VRFWVAAYVPSIEFMKNLDSKSSEVSSFAAEMVCKRKHSIYSSIISSNYVFKGLAFETLGPCCKETVDFINVIGNRLIAESDDSKSRNQRNSFSRGFPLPFNVETLQAFGALFQIPQYYRKFLYYKTKMLCNYVININFQDSKTS
jgi:hypothetical protein